MEKMAERISGPLARLSEDEIAHILRGFSDRAVGSARRLRTRSENADIDACLFGVLTFYLPAGKDLGEDQPGGDTRVRDDLGLDSLALAEAMFKIEELFDIRLENAELAEIVTLADARHLLIEKLSVPAPGHSSE